jgi:hypothetical protein
MAKESNSCVAARAFDITEKMVREWRKNEDVIKKCQRKMFYEKRNSLLARLGK